jgi:ubiquinone/menaquinone biosynthesis C-methylase UbiE
MKLANITSVYRSKLIAKTFESWLSKDKRVLDVGCGTGIVSFQLKKQFNIKVTGCDIDKYTLVNIPYKQMNSIDNIPFPKHSFDTSLFIDVLHHMNYQNQEKLLFEASRVSTVILIFELKPTVIGKICDYIINKLHNPRMGIPFTYRTPEEWQNLFKKMGFNYQKKEVQSPLWYPFNHIAFKLTLKQT